MASALSSFSDFKWCRMPRHDRPHNPAGPFINVKASNWLGGVARRSVCDPIAAAIPNARDASAADVLMKVAFRNQKCLGLRDAVSHGNSLQLLPQMFGSRVWRLQ